MFVVLYLVAVASAAVLIVVLGVGQGSSGWTILAQLVGLLVAAQVLVVLYVAFQAAMTRRKMSRRPRWTDKPAAGCRGSRWDSVAQPEPDASRHGNNS